MAKIIENPEQKHRSMLIQMLIAQDQANSISQRVAREVAFHVIESFHVSGRGWQAVEHALQQHYASQSKPTKNPAIAG